MLFTELGLGPEVLRAVEDVGYATPTPIQEKAIPWVLQGRDVLGCAQTGTGKTASFTLPMIDLLGRGRARARMPRSLILEPTRELAAQVADNFELYGKYHKLSMALLIGGESFVDQVKKLERGVDVLIATPGRMMDLFDRGNILLTDIKILVIDEADRMLDMGFIPDIERIVGLLPRQRQTLFFSATMPPEIKRLADKFLSSPEEVTVAPPATTAATVAQHLVVVHERDKRAALRSLLASDEVKNAFIFCNRKRDVAIVHGSLCKHGFNAGALHGDLAQSKRMETLEAFKAGSIDLLVCSDVAARGIDISNVSHVFNFDTPHHSEDYVHRIGRTGRAGKTGRAFTLAAPDDGKLVEAIEKLINQPIPRLELEGFDPVELSFDADPRRSRRGSKDGRGKREAAPERAASPARTGDDKRRRDTSKDGTAKNASRDEIVPRDEGRHSERHEVRREDRRPERFDRSDRFDRSRRRIYDEDEGRETVLGFGDDAPAFILRPSWRLQPPQIDRLASASTD
jgi:superfamily II DNA/RNA helicase